MSTIGRNDPCPCGSGKKYKKCHGAEPSVNTDFLYDRIRQLDGELEELLVDYARKRYGKDFVVRAWHDFLPGRDRPLSPDDPEQEYFSRWLMLDWRAEDEGSVAEEFLADPMVRIDVRMRDLLELTLNSPWSFYQALDVKPGVGLKLRDILRKQEIDVRDRSSSMILGKGHIIFARALEMDGVGFMMGSGGRVISPNAMTFLVDLRTSLEKQKILSGNPSGTGQLLALEEEFRNTYFDIIEGQDKARTDIRNTDGDKLELHSLHYSIPSFERAFQALKSLQQKSTGHNDDALMSGGGEKDEAGNPVRAVIHWLRKRKRGKRDDLITYATFAIGDSTMTVNVNSAKRSKRVQKEISERLGDEAVLLRTEIVPASGMLKRGDRLGDVPGTRGESDHDRIMRESPEARAFLKEMNEKHWAAWPDTPLPALKGMTPRQAAKDKLGRELLESVLLDFETRSDRTVDEELRLDVAKLRRDLGLV